ncbi:MAG: NAD(P)H-dependent oxidoreductase subunit E [Saprospiraceae bacterium]|nr:NAD(P)H-dependent oxidoreductase subunit E [Saprospiraceae bacterium]
MERVEIFKEFKAEKDNLIGILHELQDANPKNYLSEEDMKATAKYLNTTFSHVYGVATYYSMFSVKPRGKYIIRVCNSPVCDMKESSGIIEKLKSLLGIEIGETTKDSLFTLELTECLGRCAVSPSMMVNKDIYGSVKIDKLEEIIGRYK